MYSDENRANNIASSKIQDNFVDHQAITEVITSEIFSNGSEEMDTDRFVEVCGKIILI